MAAVRLLPSDEPRRGRPRRAPHPAAVGAVLPARRRDPVRLRARAMSRGPPISRASAATLRASGPGPRADAARRSAAPLLTLGRGAVHQGSDGEARLLAVVATLAIGGLIAAQMAAGKRPRARPEGRGARPRRRRPRSRAAAPRPALEHGSATDPYSAALRRTTATTRLLERLLLRLLDPAVLAAARHQQHFVAATRPLHFSGRVELERPCERRRSWRLVQAGARQPAIDAESHQPNTVNTPSASTDAAISASATPVIDPARRARAPRRPSARGRPPGGA